MTISLWQIFAIMAWLAICLGVAFSETLPLKYRIGIPLVVTGIIFTFGRSIFPRPPARDYVDNEKLLQKLSDLLNLGIPAAVLIFVGLCFLTWNPLVGLLGSVAIFFAYACFLLSR